VYAAALAALLAAYFVAFSCAYALTKPLVRYAEVEEPRSTRPESSSALIVVMALAVVAFATVGVAITTKAEAMRAALAAMERDLRGALVMEPPWQS
jgi:hypothetical protein